MFVQIAALFLATQQRSVARAPVVRVTRLDLTVPLGAELRKVAAQNAALSPDGTRVAFTVGAAGRPQIDVRRLDESEAVPLRGTDLSISCFFSPDGRALAVIFSDRSLKTITLADGLVLPLVSDVDTFGGGTWGSDNRITYARDGTLWQVPASGGSPKQLTTLDTGKHELLQAWPTSIAGGHVILFTSVTGAGRDAAHIEALSVATGQRRVVLDSGIFPQYAPSGHLVFFRQGALLAAPFNVERLEVTGPPVSVVEDLAVDMMGAPTAAVSMSGALVYSPSGTAASRLVWVTREGVERPITEAIRPYEIPALARDGKRLAVMVNGDLWVQDAARGTFERLTSNETVGNSYPVWTPDGKRIVFMTRTGLFWIDAEGSGRLQSIPGTSVTDIPSSISPDGQLLLFNRQTADTSSDVDVLTLGGNPQPRPVVKTPAFEGGAQFSPDGHWLAYASNESGQTEVYVRPWPGP
jgi:Tol biopolymer transport system component